MLGLWFLLAVGGTSLLVFLLLWSALKLHPERDPAPDRRRSFVVELEPPAIDETFHIQVRTGTKTAVLRLRSEEFRELLALVAEDASFFKLCLFPRAIKNRRHVFGSALAGSVGYRSGILLLMQATIDDFDPTRLEDLARAAAGLRGILPIGATD